MHFYRTIRFDGDERPRWDATLGDAHATAKGLNTGDSLRIELFDVATDKNGVLHLLDGGTVPTTNPIRTWMLTPRKGLKEIANGE